MKQLVILIAGFGIALLIGFVSLDRTSPEDVMCGTWRINIDKTIARPEYRGKSTGYLEDWRGSDADTIIRVDENTLHFWDQDWPYRVVSTTQTSVTIQWTHREESQAEESKFLLDGDGMVFVFTQKSPYVLDRISPAK